MNKFEKKFNSNDYLPKRFGLKYSPPQIGKLNFLIKHNKIFHQYWNTLSLRLESFIIIK